MQKEPLKTVKDGKRVYYDSIKVLMLEFDKFIATIVIIPFNIWMLLVRQQEKHTVNCQAAGDPAEPGVTLENQTS